MNLPAAPLKAAIKGRWAITPEQKAKIVEKAENLLDSDKDASKIWGIRLFLEMDKLNLAEQDLILKSQPKVHVHTNLNPEDLLNEIKSKMAALGIESPDQLTLNDKLLDRKLIEGVCKTTSSNSSD